MSPETAMRSLKQPNNYFHPSVTRYPSQAIQMCLLLPTQLVVVKSGTIYHNGWMCNKQGTHHWGGGRDDDGPEIPTPWLHQSVPFRYDAFVSYSIRVLGLPREHNMTHYVAAILPAGPGKNRHQAWGGGDLCLSSVIARHQCKFRLVSVDSTFA